MSSSSRSSLSSNPSDMEIVDSMSIMSVDSSFSSVEDIEEAVPEAPETLKASEALRYFPKARDTGKKVRELLEEIEKVAEVGKSESGQSDLVSALNQIAGLKKQIDATIRELDQHVRSEIANAEKSPVSREEQIIEQLRKDNARLKEEAYHRDQAEKLRQAREVWELDIERTAAKEKISKLNYQIAWCNADLECAQFDMKFKLETKDEKIKDLESNINEQKMELFVKDELIENILDQVEKLKIKNKTHGNALREATREMMELGAEMEKLTEESRQLRCMIRQMEVDKNCYWNQLEARQRFLKN